LSTGPPQQIRTRLLQVLARQPGKVDTQRGEGDARRAFVRRVLQHLISLITFQIWLITPLIPVQECLGMGG